MKIAFLDFIGTLDVLEEGYACTFVKKLQKAGWIVCLWTSADSYVIQRKCPGLAEMVDRFRSKYFTASDLFEELEGSDTHPDDVSEVVVLDDEFDIATMFVECLNHLKPGMARHVPAKQWKTLVTW